MTGFRVDIQVLRGIAILSVLGYHAQIGIFRAGYLGVDIFFVISGFLITGHIHRELRLGTFSLSAFYKRRARRLLPAAYVMFLIAALAAPYFLTSLELHDFAAQFIGAILFCANFVLWNQTGYFGGAAELKPLLHVWSLSLEEQYYLLVPILLMCVTTRTARIGAIAVVAISLGACFTLSHLWPAGTFYLLPTRAWELALGSVGALCSALVRRNWLAAAFWPAVFALLISLMVPYEGTHPGVAAVVCDAATLIVLLREHPVFRHERVWSPLTWLGDISYSLYLVHWPLFAFVNNAWLGERPTSVRLLLLLMSVALGFMSRTFVEVPALRVELSRATKPLLAMIGVCTSMSLGWLAVALDSEKGVDYAQIRRVNFGLDATCDSGAMFQPKPECQTSENPDALIWGDSFAMHLVPGLLQDDKEFGFAQATRTNCGPVLNVASFRRPYGSEPVTFDRRSAEECITFNDTVFRYLASTHSIQYVVLATPFRQYMPPTTDPLLERTNDGLSEEAPSLSTALTRMRETVLQIRRLGKKVVLVAPPPSNAFDVGLCLERRAAAKVLLGPRRSCALSKSESDERFSAVHWLFSELEQHDDVPVIDLFENLCNEQTCRTSADGIALYRDELHLSYSGSRWVGKHTDLVAKIKSVAR